MLGHPLFPSLGEKRTSGLLLPPFTSPSFRLPRPSEPRRRPPFTHHPFSKRFLLSKIDTELTTHSRRVLFTYIPLLSWPLSCCMLKDFLLSSNPKSSSPLSGLTDLVLFTKLHSDLFMITDRLRRRKLIILDYYLILDYLRVVTNFVGAVWPLIRILSLLKLRIPSFMFIRFYRLFCLRSLSDFILPDIWVPFKFSAKRKQN